MNPRSEKIPGLRRPADAERRQIAQSWKDGTNPGALRRMQLLVVAFAAVMGFLRAAGGAEGLNIGAGIASGLMILLLCSVFLILWSRQITAIASRGAKLSNGQFSVTAAEVEKAARNAWNIHYVSFAQVRLPDGTVLKNVEMPYKAAVSRERRVSGFSAYLVSIDGESKYLAIPTQR